MCGPKISAPAPVQTPEPAPPPPPPPPERKALQIQSRERGKKPTTRRDLVMKRQNSFGGSFVPGSGLNMPT